jgi:hypothetical protein
MVCDKFLFLNKNLPYFAQFFCFWGVCFNLPWFCILTLQMYHHEGKICFGVLATVLASHKIEIRERLPSGSCHPHIRGSLGSIPSSPILNLQIKLHM